ncbi:MAG: ferritin-like domain-containing protein [Myxococcota bacterium]
MDIRALILSTLTLSAAGCWNSTFGCGDPASESFTLEDEAVTAADIQNILSGWAVASSEEIRCAQVCQEVYYRIQEWETFVDDDESCSFTLDEVIEASDDTGLDGEEVVGSVTCEGEGVEYFCEGRRPLGHCEQDAAAGSLGDYLARCAHLEAASVDAFVQLADQLTRWGAPRDLIARCRAAADDEARHARAVTDLARRHGGQVLATVREDAAEDLKTVAMHNAVEGCVFETWAALSAALKAENAEDAEIRAAYAAIAAEEAAHGQLAWDLHVWLMGQLSAADRRAVADAQRVALDRLPIIADAQARQTPAEMGMPQPGVVQQMARLFSGALRAAA